MQHASHSLWRALALALALVSQVHAGDSYYGADHRLASDLGGYEGSGRSGHDHGAKGFYSYPGNFYEGRGPRNDYGHAGDARRHGSYADASGHHQGAYLVQRLFMSGGYSNPDHRLFHYRSCSGER